MIVHALFHDENGITWLGGPSGLIRYDSKIINNYEIPFNALIRSVVYGDSMLFGGHIKKIIRICCSQMNLDLI